MAETARKEKAKRKRVVVTNRELWVLGRKWRWDKGRRSWTEEEKEVTGGGVGEEGRRLTGAGRGGV